MSYPSKNRVAGNPACGKSPAALTAAACLGGALLAWSWAADAPATTPQSGQPTAPQAGASGPAPDADVNRARERVERLEARLYAQDPQLRQAEREYERLQQAHAQQIDARAGIVARYLEAEDKRRGDHVATGAYNRIRDAWGRVYAAEAAKDPQRSPMLKAVLTSDPQHREQLARELRQSKPGLDDAALKDPDRLWEAYRAASERALPGLRQDAERLEKQSGFPEFVLRHAREVSLSKFELDWLYFPYLQLNTPEELRKAREDLKRLSASRPATVPAAH